MHSTAKPDRLTGASSERVVFTAPDLTRYVEVDYTTRTCGGNSDVYCGLYRPREEKPTKVAVKVVRSQNSADDRFIRRFRREIAVWQRLTHPHVQPLLGIFWLRNSHLPAMVSPWHPNGHINDYLKNIRHHPRIEDIKLALLQQVFDAVRYLHGYVKIVHADIKGANILVDDEGKARLSDYGLSLILSPLSNRQSSTTKGTTRWMAPELFQDGSRHTMQSDVWACGCLMLEVLSGTVPYHTTRHDLAVILALSRFEQPPRHPDIPDLAWNLILQCCSIGPTVRPSISLALARLQLLRLVSDELSVTPTLVLRLNAESALSECLKHREETGTMTDALELDAAERFIGPEILESDFSLGMVLIRLCIRHLNSDTAAVMRILTAMLMLDLDILPRDMHDNQVPALELRPLARRVAEGDPAAARKLMRVFATPFTRVSMTSNITALSYTPDGSGIFIGSRKGHLEYLPSSANGLGFEPKDRLVAMSSVLSTAICSISVSRNSRFVAGGGWGGFVEVFDARTRARVRTLPWGPPYVTCSVTFLPDCTRLAVASLTGEVRVWDIEDGTCLRTVLVSPPTPSPLQARGKECLSTFASIAVSPITCQVVAATRDAAFRQHDLTTGDLIGDIQLSEVGTSNVEQSLTCAAAASRVLVRIGDLRLHVWDLKTGETHSLHEQTISPVTFAAISPDGQRVAYTSTDPTSGRMEVCLWDIGDGRVGRIGNLPRSNRVACLVFSPDGCWIACHVSDTARWYRSDEFLYTFEARADWQRYEL